MNTLPISEIGTIQHKEINKLMDKIKTLDVLTTCSHFIYDSIGNSLRLHVERLAIADTKFLVKEKYFCGIWASHNSNFNGFIIVYFKFDE